MIYPDTFEQKTGFDAVRRHIKELCVSALGVDKCEQMSFSTNYDIVEKRLRRVHEMMTILASDTDGAFAIADISDITHALATIRTAGAHVSATELQRIARTLGVMSAISTFFMKQRTDTTEGRDVDYTTPYPLLDELCSGFGVFTHIIKEIDRVIDKFGEVKDSASPELAAIRSQLASMSGVISRVMRKVIASAVKEGYLEADVTPAVRDGRPVIPVAPMHKRKIQGIVHDESATGKTVFIEPAEVVEANNRMRELQIEEKREVLRILTRVADYIRPYVDEIMDSVDILARFDFINAKAKYAVMVDAHMPTIERHPDFDWYHACHPILKLTLEKHGKQIVPIDLRLTNHHRILIISGPNAGGKSVALKTTAIIQYMMQCGVMPTVYENSHMGVMKCIFIDIGDDQSIDDDLSTYSSHLRAMKHFLKFANNRTLVLIDEFGSGTEPQIGGAIAEAILNQLNKQKTWGVITTHFHNLKQLADNTPGLINGSMLYDRQHMQPLYSLSIGNPGSSYAIEIARKTGLPPEIIKAAEEIVGSDYISLDKYLLDIARDKRYWESRRLSLKQKEKQLDELISRYSDQAENLRMQRREIIEDARSQAQKIISESNAQVERTIREIRTAQADRERTMEARRRLAEHGASLGIENEGDEAASEHPLLKQAQKTTKHSRKKTKDAVRGDAQPKSTPEAIAVGDHVLLDGGGTVGTVEEISGEWANVIFGMLRTRVKLSRLKPTLKKPKTGAKASSFISTSTNDDMRNRQLNFKQEIDVRGMRADEAVQAVTYFIDDALQFSAQRVRILHGTGTGALRQAIRAYLQTVPGVKSNHDEDVRFGGAGITVVEL